MPCAVLLAGWQGLLLFTCCSGLFMSEGTLAAEGWAVPTKPGEVLHHSALLAGPKDLLLDTCWSCACSERGGAAPGKAARLRLVMVLLSRLIA